MVTSSMHIRELDMAPRDRLSLHAVAKEVEIIMPHSELDIADLLRRLFGQNILCIVLNRKVNEELKELASFVAYVVF